MKPRSGYAFWIHSIFFTLLNRFSLIAFGLVAYILLAKKVFPTTKQMGIWALFLSILSVTETIKQGLLRNPTIKFLSEPEYVNDRDKIQSAALVINVVFSAIIALIILFGGRLIASWLNTPELYPLIRLGILMIVLLIPFNHFEILLQAHFRFHQIFYGYFLRQALFLSGLVLLLVTDKSLLTLSNLVKLQIVALGGGAVMLLIHARSFFHRGLILDKKALQRMLHFGKYIFGTNVFSTLGRSADQFITAGLISPDVVAYYNVVSRINNLMDVPSLAVADVLFPKNVQAMAEDGKEKVRYYFERMVGSILSILAPVSLLIFCIPHFFIGLVAGSKYLPAVAILQTVILFSFVRPFFYQFGVTMDAIGKPRINFWVNLLLMCLNYGCLYAGLQTMGWMGAAYGTIVYSLLAFCIILRVLQRTVGVRLGETVRYAGFAYREMIGILKKIVRGGKFME